MEEGFIKFSKNNVVRISDIQMVINVDNKIKFLCSYGWQAVDTEYEKEWRDRFDLND